MLGLYQRFSEWISSFMSRHEKDIFTTGAKVLAIICMIVAAWLAIKFSYQLFGTK